MGREHNSGAGNRFLVREGPDATIKYTPRFFLALLLAWPLARAYRTFSFGEIQMLSSLSHYDHVVTLPFPSRLHHIEHCVLSILRTGHCSRGELTIVPWHQRGTNDGFISAKAIAPARLRRDTLNLIYYLCLRFSPRPKPSGTVRADTGDPTHGFLRIL